MQAFRGWWIVAAAFWTQAVAMGFTMGTFTFFVRPLEEAFGASRTQISIGMLLIFVSMGTSLAFIGRELDRRSARAIMLLGVAFTAASLLLLSLATALWQMALLCVGIGLGIAMLGPVASSTVVANWFEEQRGRALGLAAMGAPAGPSLAAIFTAWAIPALGWRATLASFAVLTALLATPAIWFVIVNKPSDVGQLPDGKPPRSPVAPVGGHGHGRVDSGWTAGALFGNVSFWAMAITIGIAMATPIGLSAHMEPYWHSVGIEPGRTASLLVITGVSNIAGTFLFGSLADRFDLRRLLWTSLAILAACVASLLAKPSYAVMVGIFVAFGLTTGSNMPIYGSIIGRVFGPSAFGQVMGLAGLLMLPLHATAPVLVGALYDATGSYDLALEAIVASLGVAAVSLSFLRTKPA